MGTSSLRRIAQLRHIRSDLKCVPLRGNVETRIRKVAEGHVDAVVVACAGLNRMGLNERISTILTADKFVPAPAQGALAVQIRSEDQELFGLVSQLDDEYSRIAAETERCVLSELHGGCSIPLGVYSQVVDDTKVTIDAILSDIEGKRFIKRGGVSDILGAKELAGRVAGELLEAGGRAILEELRVE